MITTSTAFPRIVQAAALADVLLKKAAVQGTLLGALQTALYALIVLAAGVLLYHETLTRLQVTGTARP